MATSKSWDDLNLSKDEVERLTKALKDEEFRKLFVQYAEEISDPENKARYEAEIAQMENERGMDIKFVHPEPGYVVKTTVDGDCKAFINICKNENMGKPSSQKQTGPDGRSGLSWSIPHSFAPPRDDKDKKGDKCKIFDFVVHPDTYRMAETNARFKQMLHDTAFDGIERQFEVKLDRKNLKFPKKKFFGVATPTVIRTKKEDDDDVKEKDPDDIMGRFPYPYGKESTEEMMKKREEDIEKKESEKKRNVEKVTKKEQLEVDTEYAEPKYTIKHRSDFELQNFTNTQVTSSSLIPKELVIDISLPLLKSAAPVNLDIFEKRLVLQSEKPAKYKLDISLPYAVDENDGSAKFDKSKRQLIVTLPVTTKPEDVKPEVNGDLEQNGMVEGITEPDNPENFKPLIEVLSSNDSGIEVSDEKGSEDDLPSDTQAPKAPEKYVMEKPSIRYMMPDLDYSQDDETVSLIINVKNILHESIQKQFVSAPSYGADIKFTSVGSGGFPMHYSLCVRLEQTCSLEIDSCHVNVSPDNAVVLLVKTDESLGPWESFKAGVDVESLQEKVFVSVPSLSQRLERLEQEASASGSSNNMPGLEGGVTGAMGPQEPMPELEVTQMDSHKLEIQIKKPTSKGGDGGDDEAEVFSPVEVIHDTELPKLQSILKSRSHTTSESSCDDALSSSYSRQNSVLSTNGNSEESSLVDSDENEAEGDGTGRRVRKKSVSFSDHVDRTTYKANMSVTTMKATLKSKRRRARKKEQKQLEKQERRRRRNSNSISEPSSDDQSGQLGKDDSDESQDESEASPSQSPTEVKGQKLEVGQSEVVKGGAEEDKVEGVEEERTKTKDEIVGVQKCKERTSDEVVSNGNGHVDSDDNEPAVNGVEHKTDAKVQEIAAEEQKAEKDEYTPETMLSWEEKPSCVGDNEYKTKCAFEFTNSVMYDLDVD